MASLESLELDGLGLNVPDVPQVTNLVTNPRAGVDLTGLGGGTAGTVSARITSGLPGGYATGVETTGTAVGATTAAVVAFGRSGSGTGTGAHPVTPGSKYAGRGWVRVVSVGSGAISNISLRMYWYQADGSASATTSNTLQSQSSPVNGTDYEFEGIVTAPGDAAFGVPRVITSQTNPSSWVIRSSGAAMFAVAPAETVVPDYVDGDMAGYEWSGTAHASETVPAPPLMLSEVAFIPAKKRPEWADNSDGDGSLLIRDPLFENSQWDATVEVRAGSRDEAHTAVGRITSKLEEAERNVLGIPLVWTPADSTKGLTFYVLTGEVTEVPITHESGYFASPAPVLAVGLTLTCRPFGYGAEVTVASAAGAGPLQVFTVSGVTGDVSAEGRLIVTDTSSQARELAVWGLEYRYQSGTDLTLTTPDRTIGADATSTTRAGSVSTNIHRLVVSGTPADDIYELSKTGVQPHIGVFRVYARVYMTAVDPEIRLLYQHGDGPFNYLNWEQASPDATLPTPFPNWYEIDLGVISSPPVLLGTQRFTATVQVRTTSAAVDLDYLLLVPVAEGFGRARGSAIKSGQSIEFRSDDTIREDSTGTYYGKPNEYRGAPFFLPPAGDENRASRVVALARRLDSYTNFATNVTDNQTVEIRYTPRYLYLPR